MVDIILDDQQDITIDGGDFSLGDCGTQNQGLLIATGPGDWKQYPVRGVGAPRYLEHPDDGELARRIQTELSQDGIRVTSIDIDSDKITVQAT